MEPFSLIGIAIMFLVTFFLVKTLVESIKVVFFFLLALLLAIIFFQISYADVLLWAGKVLLWVL